MAKLLFPAIPILLFAALQPGCALVQGRADVPLASPTAHPCRPSDP